MGIKGAFARCVVGLSLLAAAAPVCAQENSDDDVASTRKPEDRADARDPGDPSERDRGSAQDDDDAPKAKPVRKTRLGAPPVDSDADDNSDVDRDGVEKDQDDDAPKRDRSSAKKDKGAASKDKDVAKKEPAKKDAPKSDKDKDKSGAASKSQQKPGGCVEVSFEARYAGIGYDHLVTLKSGCKKAMKCVVRTNVNPEPASVTLPKGGEETVVMWRGSPSRAFTPDVSCD